MFGYINNNPKCPKCNITVIKFYKIIDLDGKEIEVCRNCKRLIIKEKARTLKDIIGLDLL